MGRAKAFAKRAAAAAILLLASASLVELLTQAYVLAFPRQPFLSPDLYERIQGIGVFDPGTLQLRSKASPYFGYVWDGGNNFGFVADEDFPREKKADEYVIGVFGGSVAYVWGRYLRAHPEMIAELRAGIPALQKKKIVLLNMAISGYRQPQTFFVFSYFAEMFDVAIQLDGWNEAWEDLAGAGFPVDFPAYSHVLYGGAWGKFKLQLFRSARYCFLGAVHFIAGHDYLRKLAAPRLLAWDLDQLLARAARSFTEPGRRPRGTAAARQDADRLRIWKKYLLLEQAVARKSGVKVFFFLQPSQYNEGDKILSPEEAKFAVRPENFRGARNFARLRQAAAGLPGVVDLHAIFRDTRETVYADACCHLNASGNQVLTKSIFQSVIRQWKNQ